MNYYRVEFGTRSMFVTSDIFNLRSMKCARRSDWREHLLGGIDVHGVEWPGPDIAARFLIEATKCCGFKEMHYAGYSRSGEWRTREITPKSFERLAQGRLAGAKDAQGLLFKGEREAVGAHHNLIYFGGEADSIRQRRGNPRPAPIPGPPWRFQANFTFPVSEDPAKTAGDLLQLSVEILGVEYGYYFVRDAACSPDGYTSGITALLDGGALENDDAQEVRNWAGVVNEGLMWSRAGPIMRDLFQINLLSERHRERPMKGGQDLMKWIAAQPGRGSVQDIGKGRWLWTLTDAEMIAVRPVLCKAGWLFSCRDRVYRDLPNGGRSGAQS